MVAVTIGWFVRVRHQRALSFTVYRGYRTRTDYRLVREVAPLEACCWEGGAAGLERVALRVLSNQAPSTDVSFERVVPIETSKWTNLWRLL